MTYCPRCKKKREGKRVLLKKTDRVYNGQREWFCPDCGYVVSRDIPDKKTVNTKPVTGKNHITLIRTVSRTVSPEDASKYTILKRSSVNPEAGKIQGLWRKS